MVEKKVISLNIIKAQNQVWDYLVRIHDSKQIGSAYLFSGPSGSGKEALAIKFSQLLNCEKPQKFPCDTCPSCQRFNQLQHERLHIIFPLPAIKNSVKNNDDLENINKKDLDFITKAIDNKSKDLLFKIRIPKSNRILIESIRQLRKKLYFKMEGKGQKIVLIFDAHLLSRGQGESANALLKILEEPPENTTLILVTDHMELLLPTIISRCQRLGISKLDDEYMQYWFEQKMIKESEINILVGLSQGNIHQAKALIKESGESLIKLLNGLINMISKKDPEQWRKFIQTYSRLAHQDIDLFILHFKLIQIWFRSVNRLNKNVDDILHKTDFRLSMEQLINLFPKADYSSINFELENTILSIPKNLHMPLILTNLLTRIHKYLNR